MKRNIFILLILIISSIIFSCSAFAVTNNMVKVGLYYAKSSTNAPLISANLENYSSTGAGYTFGYYDSNRSFVALGTTAEKQISMSEDVKLYVLGDGSYSTAVPSGNYSTIGSYHLRLNQTFGDFNSAKAAADTYKAKFGAAFPAYKNGSYYVMIGIYKSSGDAQSALSAAGLDAQIDSGTGDTVTVTVTGTTTIIFEFDCGGTQYLGVEPIPLSASGKAQTWFKGYLYYGGFEYQRINGGALQVINVVNIDDYVKGVLPYEMSASWPTEALKAQAVCARSFAISQTKHSSSGFDVCATTDCQVYRGTSAATTASNSCVEATAGECLYDSGSVVEAVFFSSDGGATDSAKLVWGSPVSYLVGVVDPYEAMLKDFGVTIPSYTYSKTYTGKELSALLVSKGYTIGEINKIVVEPSAFGNMGASTFYDTGGKSITVPSTKARSVFSSRSQRFYWQGGVSGTGGSTGADSAYYINGSSNKITTIDGAYAISGTGSVSKIEGNSTYVVTSGGVASIGGNEAQGGGAAVENEFPTSTYTVTGSSFVLAGSGYGHNVGMSQYGAYAMAKTGKTYRDILNFYYTGVTIQ